VTFAEEPGGHDMHAETGPRRVWIAGHAIDVWDHPDVRFSWTPGAIQNYIDAEQWESVFNALVLLADSDPKGLA
jgi:hypothetical protein